jgi:hypothetical protein
MLNSPLVLLSRKSGGFRGFGCVRSQEKNLFKWLFPIVFFVVATQAQAQPAPPAVPVYDAQGRLIPHDGPRAESQDALEAPRPAAKPKSKTQAQPVAQSQKSDEKSSKQTSKKTSKTSTKTSSKTSGKSTKASKPAKSTKTAKQTKQAAPTKTTAKKSASAH